jgi:hypothetical protein
VTSLLLPAVASIGDRFASTSPPEEEISESARSLWTQTIDASPR